LNNGNKKPSKWLKTNLKSMEMINGCGMGNGITVVDEKFKRNLRQNISHLHLTYIRVFSQKKFYAVDFHSKRTG